MKPRLYTIKLSFLIAFLLIGTLAMVLAITSLSFIIDIGISSWQFPVSFILTAVLYFYITEGYYKKRSIFLKSALLSLATIIVSILIALSFYDLSYDGQTYHMETISLLKNGWNPFSNLLVEKNHLYLYINHYPKGLEIPQSTIYSLIGRIESAKATNIILLTATFCLSLAFLLNLNKLSTTKCILLSLFAVLNPITVNQLISTYVDGSMALLFLTFLITALFVIKKPSLENLFLLGSIIIIAANLKFNSLVYIVIFAFAFICWVVFTKKKTLVRRALYTIILSGSFAVFIVGFFPYVKNTVDFNHPFYPLMGSEKVDIISYNIPNTLEQKGAFGRFFTSFFSHTDNMMNDHDRGAELKIPFTFNKVDILSAGKVDTRIAGFGPLFSGIFIVSLVLFIAFLVKFKKRHLLKGLFYIIIVLIFSVVIMPDSWWARYIPQLWFIPIIILLAIELYVNKPTKAFKFCKSLIYIAIIVNISFTFVGIGWNFMMTRLVDYQLEILKASEMPVKVKWGVCSTNYIRFQENNISYIETDIGFDDNVQKIVRSNNSIFLIDSTVNIPKSKLIKWAENYIEPTERL